MQNWISIKKLKPTYYSDVLCINAKNEQRICWRASNGEADLYTISGTDNLLIGVTHWMNLPDAPNK